MLKRNLVLGAAVAAFSTTPAFAGERLVEEGFLAGELSANVAFTSDYVFRGFSQTDENFAVQGGFDYAFDNGLYVGTWASNIDFGDSTNVEIDVYGGYAGSIDFLSYDVGVIYYIYTNQPDATPEQNFIEFTGTLGAEFGIVGVEAGVAYSPDFYLETGDAVYLFAGPTISLPEDLAPVPISLDARIGHQDVEDGGNYTEWEIGLNVTAFTLDWRAAYTDTDQDGDLSDSRVYFSVGKSF
ncbi:MAG: TorF family putative porin [Pseudomonadota bacterium]